MPRTAWGVMEVGRHLRVLASTHTHPQGHVPGVGGDGGGRQTDTHSCFNNIYIWEDQQSSLHAHDSDKSQSGYILRLIRVPSCQILKTMKIYWTKNSSGMYWANFLVVSSDL